MATKEDRSEQGKEQAIENADAARKPGKQGEGEHKPEELTEDELKDAAGGFTDEWSTAV